MYSNKHIKCPIVDFAIACRGENKCKYKTVYEQLKRKEEECEELKEELHQNFKEKDGLHLIIDRLLEASGYDTNTASAEDFEDVYENMRYEKQQLYQLKQTLQEIKEIAEKQCNICEALTPIDEYKDCKKCWQGAILQKSANVR